MFLSIVYTMTGLPRDLDRFLLFNVIGVLVGLISEGMGLAIGSVFNVTVKDNLLHAQNKILNIQSISNQLILYAGLGTYAT